VTAAETDPVAVFDMRVMDPPRRSDRPPTRGAMSGTGRDSVDAMIGFARRHVGRWCEVANLPDFAATVHVESLLRMCGLRVESRGWRLPLAGTMHRVYAMIDRDVVATVDPVANDAADVHEVGVGLNEVAM